MLGISKLFKRTPSFFDETIAEAKRITSGGAGSEATVTFEDNAPFRLKKGEQYIGSASATLGTFKRTGKFAYAAVTTRIRVAKGINIRLGGGQVAAEKDWVFDQTGTLHFTTDRVIFDSDTKNTSVRWDKTLNMQISDKGNQILIDKETGADLLFNLDTKLTIHQAALAMIVQQGIGAV